jgi:hypothetical protein
VDERPTKYLLGLLRALLPAIWRGFERTDVLIVLLIVLAFAWNQVVPHYFHEPYHPPGRLVAWMVCIFIVYEICKGFLRLYAEERSRRERLEEYFTPRLRAGQLMWTPWVGPPGPVS